MNMNLQEAKNDIKILSVIVFLLSATLAAIILLFNPAIIHTQENYTQAYNDGVHDVLEAQNRCDMRFPNKNFTARSVHGLYNNPNYFCVWTKNREPQEIAETTFHELAHYYAHNNPEHFNVEVEQ